MSALPTLVIGAFRSDAAFLARSMRHESLVFCVRRERLAHAGQDLGAAPRVCRGLVLIVAARGATVGQGEIFDAIWGDDASGGPLHLPSARSTVIHQMRAAAARLGVEIETAHGWGIRASLSGERRAA